MSDWLDDAVKKAKERVRYRANSGREICPRAKTEAATRRRIHSRSCIEWLTKNIADFNTKFGSSVLNMVSQRGDYLTLSATLSAKHHKSASLSYESITQKFTWTAPATAPTAIHLELSGDRAILAKFDANLLTAQRFGQEIIDSLLGLVVFFAFFRSGGALLSAAAIASSNRTGDRR